MTGDLISKATRNKFREVLVRFVLREIDMIFEGVGLESNMNHKPSVDGQRRSKVEQYYVNIDFGSRNDVQKVLKAYAEVLYLLEHSSDRFSDRERIVGELLRRMKLDGYMYKDNRFVALARRQSPFIETIKNHAAALDLDGLHPQLERLAAATETDPALAVGTAKELVETVCKSILEDRGYAPKNEDLPKLLKTVAKELSLLPEDISEQAKGSDVIRRLLSSLGQITQGLAELRNLYGTGHGHSGRSKGVQPRHANLAIGSAATLAVFLLETHLERANNTQSSTLTEE